MKVPYEPPDSTAFFQQDIGKMLEDMARPEVQSLLRKALQHYPYWDKFRYWPMPSGITPEAGWFYREMMAAGKWKHLPLVDVQGREFIFWVPDPAQQDLHWIDRNSAGRQPLEGRPISSEEQDRYIVSSLMEEAIASSQIEGAATTRRVAKEMLRVGRAPADKSERMILNNYRAMERLRKLKDEPLSLEMLNGLHAILTEGTLDKEEDPGRLRTSPEDDDVSVYDSDGMLLHKPPPGRELPVRLAKLIDFANSDGDGEFLHPAVKAVLLHFWVGYDHPYVDGNGRVARAVFYWYLLRKGYWLFEFISLSRMVLRAAGQYKRAFLFSERGRNDATYFLMYNLQAIRLAIAGVWDYVDRKQKEAEEAAILLHKIKGVNSRQRELLLDAVKRPGRTYTIYGHGSTHQVTYQTANRDMMTLVQKGFLEIVGKSGRTYQFMPTEKLKKFAEAAAADR